MINNILRWQVQDKSIPYNMFVLFNRPVASFTNNIIYINQMEIVKVNSQGDFPHEWPSYFQLKQFKHSWTLRSSPAIQLVIPLVVSYIIKIKLLRV